ncbi:MAG: sec-independent protein translocase protein TatB [Patiriisocius sp.]|jgi:sec-independent protein translocase protein TatB
MFDIGFLELALISIVALLVIGPERLPETIRTIMLWLGRIRRTFANIKNELEQEIGADEIRRQLHNETIMKDIKEAKESISGALKETDQSINDFRHSLNESIDSAEPSLQPNNTETVAPPAISDTSTDSTKDSANNDEPKRSTS